MTEKNEPKAVAVPETNNTLADDLVVAPVSYDVKMEAPPNTISFHVKDDSDVAILRITPEGFYVRDKKVPADAEEAQTIYAAFREWLNAMYDGRPALPPFRYYILDTFDGAYKGTNNEETAKSYTYSDDHFVVDAHLGKFMPAPGEVLDVEDVD